MWLFDEFGLEITNNNLFINLYIFLSVTMSMFRCFTIHVKLCIFVEIFCWKIILNCVDLGPTTMIGSSSTF